MKKIKLYATCYWQDDAALYNYLSIYSNTDYPEWKNIAFTLSENYDLAIIFTAPHKEHKKIKESSSIIFRTEPPQSKHHFKQEGFYISDMYCPEIFWGLTEQDINFLRKGKFIKKECLSSITSELAILEGHQKRLTFIAYLDKIVDEGFTLFGRKYSGKYFSLIKSYQGEIMNKLDGLINFRYHFACENSFTKDYFTEKILQPIITGTLCYYDGCTNIHNYIRPECFVKISIDNMTAAAETIIRSIESDDYSAKKIYIEKERMRILEQYNMLNIVWAEVNGVIPQGYFKI